MQFFYSVYIFIQPLAYFFFYSVLFFVFLSFLALMHLKLCKWLNKQTRLYTKNTSTNTTIYSINCNTLKMCLSIRLFVFFYFPFSHFLFIKDSDSQPLLRGPHVLLKHSSSAPQKPNLELKLALFCKIRELLFSSCSRCSPGPLKGWETLI